MANLIQLNSEEMLTVWDVLEPDFDNIASTSRGKVTPIGLRQAIHDGSIQLWAVIDNDEIVGTVMTELASYELQKVGRSIACVGAGRARWEHLIGVLEDWARGQGCETMQIIGREGWSKVLQKFGYVKTHVLLEKTL